MIIIILGNLGSGKSAAAVRDLYNDRSGRITYTNIKTTGIDHVRQIKPSNVIKKSIKSETIKKDGSTEIKYKLDLNKEYWMKQPKALNILWDEIHLTANSRQSMSAINQIIGRFIAMGRRITGYDKKGYEDCHGSGALIQSSK